MTDHVAMERQVHEFCDAYLKVEMARPTSPVVLKLIDAAGDAASAQATTQVREALATMKVSCVDAATGNLIHQMTLKEAVLMHDKMHAIQRKWLNEIQADTVKQAKTLLMRINDCEDKLLLRISGRPVNLQAYLRLLETRVDKMEKNLANICTFCDNVKVGFTRLDAKIDTVYSALGNLKSTVDNAVILNHSVPHFESLMEATRTMTADAADRLTRAERLLQRISTVDISGPSSA